MIPLLLDTHIWIWLLQGGQGTLALKTRRQVEEAGKQNSLLISAITIWEVSMLDAKGRVRLGRDCLAWVREALTAPGLSMVPLTPEIAVGSNRLPGDFHGDPADRIIVETARQLGAKLLTRDTKIIDYSRQGFVKSERA